MPEAWGTGDCASGEPGVLIRLGPFPDTEAATGSDTVTASVTAKSLGDAFRVDRVLRRPGLLWLLAVRQVAPATHEQRRREKGDRSDCDDAARAIGGLPRGLENNAAARSPGIAR